MLENAVPFSDSKSVLTHATFTVASVLGQVLRIQTGEGPGPVLPGFTITYTDKTKEMSRGFLGYRKEAPLDYGIRESCSQDKTKQMCGGDV